MSFSIIAKGAKAPVGAPIYGNLVNTENMVFCTRPRGFNSLIDLSDNEHSLSFKDPNSISATVNQYGLNVNTVKDYVVINTLDMKDLQDYTISGVFSANGILFSYVPTGRIGILSDYASSNVSHMLTTTIQNEVLRFRFFFGGANKANPSVADNQYRQIDLTTSNVLVADKSGGTHHIKPTYFAVSLFADYANDLCRIRIYLPSFQSSAMHSSDIALSSLSSDLRPSAKKAVPIVTPRNLVFGSTEEEFDTGASSKSIPELRIDSVELTHEQILAQYEETKKSLALEGVLDIAHWL